MKIVAACFLTSLVLLVSAIPQPGFLRGVRNRNGGDSHSPTTRALHASDSRHTRPDWIPTCNLNGVCMFVVCNWTRQPLTTRGLTRCNFVRRCFCPDDTGCRRMPTVKPVQDKVIYHYRCK
ncbi:hypothetical protein ACOMHN_005673 [Nucella lapillus]